MSISVQCTSIPTQVVGLDWYSGQNLPENPALAICYKNGRIQLMKNHNDDGK